MAMKILPYKAGSESAKALADALGIVKLRQEGSRWAGKATDIVVNWGTSRNTHPAFSGQARILNHPDAVANASNKLYAFRKFEENNVRTPKFTTDYFEASRWLEEGTTVVQRMKLNGHSGEGISIINAKEWTEGSIRLDRAPLYTNYIKKSDEYRIHVFGDQAFFLQRKARKTDVPDEEVNWQVRNHANGFIYAHQGVEVPDEAKTLAVAAVKALGLDFGAVDLLLTKSGRWYVLEVNTACGLEGTTLDKYVEQLRNLL